LFVILFGIPLVMAAFTAASIAMISRAGTLEVSIHQKGCGGHIGMRLPAAILPAAMAIASVSIPRDAECESHSISMGQREVPCDVLAAALAELPHCPDGVLVEIRTREEVVLVEKRAGRLIARIDTPDETVSAAIPLHAARSLWGVI
jgi:hypothetical protein